VSHSIDWAWYDHSYKFRNKRSNWTDQTFSVDMPDDAWGGGRPEAERDFGGLRQHKDKIKKKKVLWEGTIQSRWARKVHVGHVENDRT
jgi:hypothetical protein